MGSLTLFWAVVKTGSAIAGIASRDAASVAGLLILRLSAWRSTPPKCRSFISPWRVSSQEQPSAQGMTVGCAANSAVAYIITPPKSTHQSTTNPMLTMKSGIELIAEERLRQISQERYTPEHDDSHADDELVFAAIAYLEVASGEFPSVAVLQWPWDTTSFKPDQFGTKNLAKAGALIASEIDRRRRLQVKEVAS
jgi:hypothetical protein